MKFYNAFLFAQCFLSHFLLKLEFNIGFFSITLFFLLKIGNLETYPNGYLFFWKFLMCQLWKFFADFQSSNQLHCFCLRCCVCVVSVLVLFRNINCIIIHSIDYCLLVEKKKTYSLIGLVCLLVSLRFEVKHRLFD